MPFKRVKSAITSDSYVPSKVKTPSVFIKTLRRLIKLRQRLINPRRCYVFLNRRIISANNHFPRIAKSMERLRLVEQLVGRG